MLAVELGLGRGGCPDWAQRPVLFRVEWHVVQLYIWRHCVWFWTCKDDVCLYIWVYGVSICMRMLLTHVRVVGICICKCVSGMFACMRVLGVSVYEHCVVCLHVRRWRFGLRICGACDNPLRMNLWCVLSKVLSITSTSVFSRIECQNYSQTSYSFLSSGS